MLNICIQAIHTEVFQYSQLVTSSAVTGSVTVGMCEMLNICIQASSAVVTGSVTVGTA